jgi:hypothetical protein
MRRAFRCGATAAALVLIAAAAGLAEPQPTGIWLRLPAAETEAGETILSIMDVELRSELQRRGFSVVPEPAAAVALVGSLRIEGAEIVLGVRGYELSTGGEILDIEQRASEDIGLYNQVGSLADLLVKDLLSWVRSPKTHVVVPRHELMPRAAEAVRPQPEESAPAAERVRAEAEAPEPAHIRVTLLSRDEGAEIYVGQGQLAGRIEGGRLAVEAPAGGTLSVEKRKAGYHPDREDFQLGEQAAELPLKPLRRIARYGLELFYTSSQFLGLGAGFRWYLIPDYLLLRADGYGYFSAGSAFHEDIRLTLGSYLFTPPQRRVRLAVASGLGVILSAFEGSAYGDWYWEMADLWLDLNWSRWAVFFRAELRYALGLGGGLLERGFLTGYGPQYSIGWLWKW